MSQARARVAELARTVGLQRKQGLAVDWPAVEASLGLKLPDDYKELVETFPAGRFQGIVSLIRPGDHEYPKTEFLGYYGLRLDDLRGWRKAGQGEYPYPIFPEAGGLLPWGTGPQGELFFWITSHSDPSRWTIAYAQNRYTSWTEYPGDISQLLTELVSAPSPTGPRFDRAQAMQAPVPAPIRELYWDRKRISGSGASSAYRALSRLLEESGCPPIQTPKMDWALIEERLGLPLPTDYKAFIDAYGPGTLCDVMIAAPETPIGQDLFHLLERKRTEAGVTRPEWAPPVYPEAGGLISWGETTDGWTCGWAPTSVDPDTWGVVVADPGQQLQGVAYTPNLSFSAYLANYLTQDDSSPVFLGRPPWTGPITFTPAGEGI